MAWVEGVDRWINLDKVRDLRFWAKPDLWQATMENGSIVEYRIDPAKLRAAVGYPDPPPPPPPDPATIPIGNLPWPLRVKHVLEHQGIKTVADLLEHSCHSLMRFPNIGKVSIDDIEAILAEYGWKLSEP